MECCSEAGDIQTAARTVWAVLSPPRKAQLRLHSKPGSNTNLRHHLE